MKIEFINKDGKKDILQVSNIYFNKDESMVEVLISDGEFKNTHGSIPFNNFIRITE